MIEVIREALDNLLESLGSKNTVELVMFALPHIAERKETLKQLLQAGDWEAAARVAHKTLSSVRLYGSKQLEVLLQQVRQQAVEVISTPEFQARLDAAFSTVISGLDAWLASEVT